MLEMKTQEDPVEELIEELEGAEGADADDDSPSDDDAPGDDLSPDEEGC